MSHDHDHDHGEGKHCCKSCELGLECESACKDGLCALPAPLVPPSAAAPSGWAMPWATPPANSASPVSSFAWRPGTARSGAAVPPPPPPAPRLHRLQPAAIPISGAPDYMLGIFYCRDGSHTLYVGDRILGSWPEMPAQLGEVIVAPQQNGTLLLQYQGQTLPFPQAEFPQLALPMSTSDGVLPLKGVGEVSDAMVAALDAAIRDLGATRDPASNKTVGELLYAWRDGHFSYYDFGSPPVTAPSALATRPSGDPTPAPPAQTPPLTVFQRFKALFVTPSGPTLLGKLLFGTAVLVATVLAGYQLSKMVKRRRLGRPNPARLPEPHASAHAHFLGDEPKDCCDNCRNQSGPCCGEEHDDEDVE